jgi:aerobic carbon-monoxide dehydrogenase medium subunit
VCGSLAHADPAAELPAVALALDATLVVASNDGTRRVVAAEFFRSYLETALTPHDLLVAVEVPLAKARTGTAFCEVSRRNGDFAMVGAAAVVTLDDAGCVTGARVALSGVAVTPKLAELGDSLTGLHVDDLRTSTPGDAVAAVARRTAAAVDPPADIHATADYRRRLTEVLVARALRGAAQRAIQEATS